jgi:hypothetical protein
MTSDHLAHTRRRLDAGSVVQIQSNQQMMLAVTRFELNVCTAHMDDLCASLLEPGIPAPESD